MIYYNHRNKREQQKHIGVWCNGNTQDFDSCFIGSSPIIPAKGLLNREISECCIINDLTVISSAVKIYGFSSNMIVFLFLIKFLISALVKNIYPIQDKKFVLYFSFFPFHFLPPFTNLTILEGYGSLKADMSK